jgi:hypothetical protein
MKKNLIIFSSIILIVVILVAFVYAFYSEKNINTKIKKANYCTVKEDCVFESFRCPFGCGDYINKKELPLLKK